MHLKLIIIKSRLFNNMPLKATIAAQRKNIAEFNAAQLDLPIQHQKRVTILLADFVKPTIVDTKS